MNTFNFTITGADVDKRIDHFLVSRLDDISRTRIQKLITEGFVTVNFEEVRANYRLREDDEIEATIPESPEFQLVEEELPLQIVFEDKELMVIDKPAAVVVHPAVGNYTGTLLNGLLYYLRRRPDFNSADKPGLVHRLDKDTSGLILVAKNERALRFLQEELQSRRLKREYQALVWGHVKDRDSKIELPIGRSHTDRVKMTVTDKHSRSAITKYNLLTRFKFADHLDINLQTGRTHQIRVHFSYLGHPVIGDREYGGDEKILTGIFDQYRPEARNILQMIPRQALHAYKLQFKHPSTGLIHMVKSELPEDIRKVIAYLQEIEAKG